MSNQPWRVGGHYGIHVYQGDLPVATFFRPEDAARTVQAVNDLQRRDREILSGIDLIDTKEAAGILKVSRQRIQQLASAGTLPSIKIGTSFAFSRETIRKRAERLGRTV